MKKTLLLAMAFFALKAATAQRTETHFGLKAGVNVANIKIQNAGEGDGRIGFHVGGLAHIHITDKFALQPELVFSAQGRRETINGIKYKTNLSYINLPVLGQYMTGSGFRLETGPQLGLLVAAETGVEDDLEGIRDQYKKIDVSWAFGAGYLIPGSGLGFDARYNLGLSNINDLSSRQVKNRVFQFGVFYQFMH
jgi:hypothetical protein